MRSGIVFVPFLGDFLSIIFATVTTGKSWMTVFVPFLGDFLSITLWGMITPRIEASFRPLSWGLSFN